MSTLKEVETILYNRNQYYEEEEETDAIDWLIKRVKDNVLEKLGIKEGETA